MSDAATRRQAVIDAQAVAKLAGERAVLAEMVVRENEQAGISSPEAQRDAAIAFQVWMTAGRALERAIMEAKSNGEDSPR